MQKAQDPWEGLRIQVRQRLAQAVDKLLKTGCLSRSDLQQIGEVSVAQASADINEIKRRMPGLMEYDLSQKKYRLRDRRKGSAIKG